MLVVLLVIIWALDQLAIFYVGLVAYPEYSFIDGPLQLLNPLRRIAQGESFEYFHGKAIPYLHYPIYALSGQSILGMEVARYIMSGLVYVGFVGAIAVTGFRRTNHRLLFVALMIGFYFLAEQHVLFFPRTSLYGVRTAFPLLAFAILMSDWTPRWKGSLYGIVLGLTFWLGTEHGLALSGATLLVGAVVLVRSRAYLAENVRFLLLVVGTTSVTFVLTGLLVSGSWQGLQTTLAYNYREIIEDQVWYFGVPPNPFVHLRDWQPFFPPDLAISPIFDALYYVGVLFISVALLLWLVVRGLRVPQHRLSTSRLFAQGVLLTYGIVSTTSFIVGYASPHFVIHFWRVAFIVGMTLALNDEVHQAVMQWRQPRRRALQFGSVVLLLLTLLPPMILHLRDDWQTVRAQLDEFGLQIAVHPQWTAYEAALRATVLDDAAATSDALFWSTYNGWLHHQLGLSHPAEDYIIHALGTERRTAYVQTFVETAPQWVETMRRDASPYEDWLWRHNWSFYREVMQHYTPRVTTNHSILWERSRLEPAASATAPQTTCVTENLNPYDFPFPPQVLAEASQPYRAATVELHYKTTNPLDWLPILGSLPRYFVFIDEGQSVYPASLPPHRESFAFPVFWRAGQAPRLVYDVRSLSPGASLTVQSVCVTPLNLAAEHIAALLDPTTIPTSSVAAEINR